ncbi:MAG: methyltransferase domain-containing protein [Opitutales bacterium]
MKKQNYGKNPIKVRKTDQYRVEYIHQFVEKWDELIDWDAREASEGEFFINELKKRGARRILDVACGTGFHTIRLLRAGFDVISADGSPEMLAKAFANGRDHGYILRTVQADWRWLNRDIHGKFDAVICLGNSFTHLHSEHDRRKALAEFYAVLNHDGVLILDQRNYDSMLDHGFSSKHVYYYCGDNVKAEPEYIDPGLARFRYEFPDKSVFYLNMFPLRKDYTTRLMGDVGFQTIHTFGDFKETYHDQDPDFYVHVAEKKYVAPDALKEKKAGYSEPVSVSRDYYNSSAADRFYATVWGGEDIHIGIYEKDDDSIFDASRRTVEQMISYLPEITPDTSILDLGAGYGGAGRLLAKKFGCHVTCLNLSEIQNERNRQLNEEQGLSDQVDVIDGNFEDVPFPSETFDIVWCQDSLLHSGERKKVFSEVARLLKPGGTFIFTDPMQSDACTAEAIQPVLDRLHLKSMGSIDFYRNLARENGLEEVKVEDLSEQLVNHYSSVLNEVNRRNGDVIEACGQEYVDRMRTGLGYWVENGKKGNLQWGIMLFRKQ